MWWNHIIVCNTNGWILNVNILNCVFETTFVEHKYPSFFNVYLIVGTWPIFLFSTIMQILQRLLTIFKTQSYGLEHYKFQCNPLQSINPMCWCHTIIKFCKNVLILWINFFSMLIFGPIDNCVQNIVKWFLYVLCGMLHMVEVLDQMLLSFSWSIG
jgi:hypothetical protein